MDNLSIYKKFAEVPIEAQKKINGGRMSGKTDINPMFRIKALTEMFGPCGMGWYYEITEKRLEKGTDEISAFVDINLYVKYDGEWSKPIQGTGGNSFVAKEKNGLYQSDECFKMALTDALSVACKALGIGALVYWELDSTKYDIKEDKITEELSKCKTLAEITAIYNREKAVTKDLNGLVQKCSEQKKAIEVTPDKLNWEEVKAKLQSGILIDDIRKEYYISDANVELLMSEAI